MLTFVDLASNPANVTAPGPQAAGLKKVGAPRDLGRACLSGHPKERSAGTTPPASPKDPTRMPSSEESENDDEEAEDDLGRRRHIA